MDEQRRKFLKQLGLLGASALAGPVLPACEAIFSHKTTTVPGRVWGGNATIGHALRDGKDALRKEPELKGTVDVLIVGGGVAGLSAARALQQQGKNWQLLELDQSFGGNSAGGENDISAYPWGAHYLPIPDGQIPEIMEFLEEAGVIEGYDAQERPLFREEYLCHDPSERVYHNGRWFEGLVPTFHLTSEDRAEFKRFRKLMASMQQAMGKDGRRVFAMPVDASSADPEWRRLDRISMADWLEKEQLKSSFLYNYIDYYCRDDYGTSCAQTSAWAGLHYWAGRAAKAGNADERAVLTWPEGNNWLVKQLLRQLPAEKRRTGQVVYRVERNEVGAAAWVWDWERQSTYQVQAKHVIMALPSFVAQRLVPDRPVQQEGFSYAPWVVANISCKRFPNGTGIPLCWDNVIYNSPSLGYVNACHQHLNPAPNKHVLTYYYALSEWEPSKGRKWAVERSHAEWVAFVMEEMEKVHPGFEQYVERIDVWIWGHGMIRPTVGFIWGGEREAAQASWKECIHFAHSDLSGLSVFEEAFWQGIKAAKAC